MNALDGFPHYASIKKVRAAPIVAVGTEDTGFVVILEAGTDTTKEVHVPDSFFARGQAQPGDYIVQYDDGYLSWSPKAAFDAGYRAL